MSRHHFSVLLDWWVAVLMGCLILVCVMGIPVLLWQDQIPWVARLLATLFLTGFILLWVDTAFFMHYYLTDTALIIRSQLRNVEIPYRHIRNMKTGSVRHLVSGFGHKRWALSRTNVVLTLQGGRWRQVSLSPQDPEEFISHLHHHLDHS